MEEFALIAILVVHLVEVEFRDMRVMLDSVGVGVKKNLPNVLGVKLVLVHSCL
jgi:hypothetical protein